MALLELDADEQDLAHAALTRCRNELSYQLVGEREMRQIGGAAWFTCKMFVMPRIEALIARIEQHQKDVDNGDA